MKEIFTYLYIYINQTWGDWLENFLLSVLGLWAFLNPWPPDGWPNHQAWPEPISLPSYQLMYTYVCETSDWYFYSLLLVRKSNGLYFLRNAGMPTHVWCPNRWITSCHSAWKMLRPDPSGNSAPLSLWCLLRLGNSESSLKVSWLPV